jgi:hypothetical protein
MKSMILIGLCLFLVLGAVPAEGDIINYNFPINGGHRAWAR